MAKSAEAFRTISEAADELGVARHVLRFWETRFSFIRPMKRAGGRRFYRPSDVAVLGAVRALLHEQGYTIKGVQKLYAETGLKRVIELGRKPKPSLDGGRGPASGVGGPLRAALADLEAAKARLDLLLGGRKLD